LVAAAFEAQMVDQVPMGPGDRRMGIVVTERGVYGPERG
jgi:5-formyltetrahydrofolate cyclo-ligase